MQAATKLHTLLDKAAETVTEAELGFLKDVVTHYPYFQAARFKYVEALQAQGALGFENELSILAMHTVNRKVLFDTYYQSENNDDKLESPVAARMGNYQLSGSIENSDSDAPLVESPNSDFSYTPTAQFDIETAYKEPEPEKIKNKRSLELIDSFLGNTSKTTRITPSEKATNAIETPEHNYVPEDLVSETLAKIYIKQNKIEEAIRIYEQLSLLEPEKKLKFARLIDEQKKKLE